ncbi:MAG: cysteine-rich small domain-containing protein [Clostridia bacterium]|nr:cysteine-rich small domain-containing protein [Clostridia bacterium]
MRSYAFFRHTACEYFPCHQTDDPESFNCLFCYCPLYALGEACGGDFAYTKSGVKDCSACAFPHKRENYDAVVARCGELARLAGKKEK